MIVATKAPKTYLGICERKSNLDYLARWLNVCVGEKTKAMRKSILKALQKYTIESKSFGMSLSAILQSNMQDYFKDIDSAKIDYYNIEVIVRGGDYITRRWIKIDNKDFMVVVYAPKGQAVEKIVEFVKIWLATSARHIIIGD